MVANSPTYPGSNRRASRLAAGRSAAPSADTASSVGVLLVVAAELLAHRRQQLVAVDGLAARSEASEQRGAEHVRRHALVDRGQHRPATLARVRDAAGELVELG